MPYDRRYSKAGESVLPTYDYTEKLDEDTGYVILYAGTGTDENLLRSSTFYSNEIATSVDLSSLSDTYASKIDMDFDIEFNNTRMMKGTAYVTFAMGLWQDSGETITIKMDCKIRKYDGSTETEIANNESDPYVSTSAGAAEGKMYCVEIPITTSQIFKPGDVLRLSMIMYAKNTAGGASSGRGGYGHDPKDRNLIAGNHGNKPPIKDTDSTILQFEIPIKVNL